MAFVALLEENKRFLEMKGETGIYYEEVGNERVIVRCFMLNLKILKNDKDLYDKIFSIMNIYLEDVLHIDFIVSSPGTCLEKFPKDEFISEFNREKLLEEERNSEIYRLLDRLKELGCTGFEKITIPERSMDFKYFELKPTPDYQIAIQINCPSGTRLFNELASSSFLSLFTHIT